MRFLSHRTDLQAGIARVLRPGADRRALTRAVTFVRPVPSNSLAAIPAADMEGAMWRKIAISLAPLGGAAMLPASAQAQSPSWDTWFGPWSMWGAWSSWWWICPLMLVLMVLVMMAACRFMCSWQRD
jgi:hypothetical protein